MQELRLPAPGLAPGDEGHAADDADAARFAEIEGRRTRATRFSFREADRADVLPDDPRRYVLELTAGALRRSIPVTEADVKGLEMTARRMLMGDKLPVEG